MQSCNLCVGNDDHAACVGKTTFTVGSQVSVCHTDPDTPSQGESESVWAKPVGGLVGKTSLLLSVGESGGTPLQPALAITKQSCGRRPWQNAKHGARRTAHLRRISGYQARVAHLRSSNICQLLLQPNTHQHQHQGIMNTFT